MTSPALDSRRASLSVVDGNLVLNVQPTGLIMIFR